MTYLFSVLVVIFCITYIALVHSHIHNEIEGRINNYSKPVAYIILIPVSAILTLVLFTPKGMKAFYKGLTK